MTLELASASAEVVIVGGGVLVGRALELLLWSAECNVKFFGELRLGEQGLGESGIFSGIRLLILAPGASAGCREAALALIGARTAAARIEVIELVDDRQEALLGARDTLHWPCRSKDLKRRVMAALRDNPGASPGGWGSYLPQKAREVAGGTGLD